MTRLAISRLSSGDRGRSTVRRRSAIAVGCCVIASAFSNVSVAPSAAADTTDSLRAAVSAAGSPSCSPRRSQPVIDEAAKEINETTDRWINFASRAVPETDALPVLKDLGFPATKAKILSGSAKNPADSIKATLLQGFADLPDCSYTDFGVSSMYNAKKDVELVTVVLAG